MKMCISFTILFYMLVCFSENNALVYPASCPNLTFGSIPTDHLYHEKTKPLIIAHRGQPKVYQENTYDGIISTLQLKSDGYELDIYLTKDEKLVVFHDENTKVKCVVPRGKDLFQDVDVKFQALTGVDMFVWNSTYAELQTLNITNKITKGGKTYMYDKSRKIPLLEDILKDLTDFDVIHYLEMKPSTLSPDHPKDLAEKTGQMVADMILKYNLQKKAIVVSFDYRKVFAVKNRNLEITVGTLFNDKFILIPKALLIANSFQNLTQCLTDAPNDQLGFFRFLLESGILFKYAGSSSFDCDISLYDNPKYTNNTVSMMRQNYGTDVSTGFYTVYSMSKSEQDNQRDEVHMKELIRQGGGRRLITDDVPRLRQYLGRMANSSGKLQCFYCWLILAFSVIVFQHL